MACKFKNSGDLTNIPEEREHLHFAVNVFDLGLFSKVSSLTKLKRVVALCKRFIYNLKKKVAAITTNKLDQSLLTDTNFPTAIISKRII